MHELREALAYDQESGEIRWRIRVGQRALAGSIAGTPGVHPYGRIMFRGKVYLAHRVAWFLHYGEWPEQEIDHIDGNRGNNRICNLRDVAPIVNCQNLRTARTDSRSGLLGCHWNKKSNAWHAQIRFGGRIKHIGSFTTKDEAHAAYLNVKREVHAGCTI